VEYLAIPEASLRNLSSRYKPVVISESTLLLTAEQVFSVTPAHTLRQFMMCCVPQRSALWLALRAAFVTGTSVAAALGFYEACCIAEFGQSASYVDHMKVMHVLDQLKNGIKPPTTSANVAMHYGTLHEANCKMVALAVLPDMSMQEVGLVAVQLSSVPTSVLQGIAVESLPRLAASPDGLITLGAESCTVLAKHMSFTVQPGSQMLFEAKCKSGFIAHADGSYRCVGPSAKPPRDVLPQWYAQIQLGMLALGVEAALLVVYHTGQSMLVCIPRDDTWCRMMFQALQRFMRTYVLPTACPLPPADFCKELEGYTALVDHTVKRCESVVSNCWFVQSPNNTTGPCGERWLNA
jgi:hypothetical protein